MKQSRACTWCTRDKLDRCKMHAALKSSFFYSKYCKIFWSLQSGHLAYPSKLKSQCKAAYSAGTRDMLEHVSKLIGTWHTWSWVLRSRVLRAQRSCRHSRLSALCLMTEYLLCLSKFVPSAMLAKPWGRISAVKSYLNLFVYPFRSRWSQLEVIFCHQYGLQFGRQMQAKSGALDLETGNAATVSHGRPNFYQLITDVVNKHSQERYIGVIASGRFFCLN